MSSEKKISKSCRYGVGCKKILTCKFSHEQKMCKYGMRCRWIKTCNYIHYKTKPIKYIKHSEVYQDVQKRLSLSLSHLEVFGMFVPLQKIVSEYLIEDIKIPKMDKDRAYPYLTVKSVIDLRMDYLIEIDGWQKLEFDCGGVMSYKYHKETPEFKLVESSTHFCVYCHGMLCLLDETVICRKYECKFCIGPKCYHQMHQERGHIGKPKYILCKSCKIRWDKGQIRVPGN